MTEEKIILDQDTFKALAVDTRINILKLLLSKQYTASEIAQELDMSKSAVKEHLDVLTKSKLIKIEDTKRKWKYYSLTLKGKRVVQPKDVKVLVGFCLSTFGAIASAVMFAKNYLQQGVQNTSLAMQRSVFVGQPGAVEEAAMEVMADTARVAEDEMVQKAATEAAPLVTQETAELSTFAMEPAIEHAAATPFPWEWLTISVLLFILAALLLGMYLKRPNVMVIKHDRK